MTGETTYKIRNEDAPRETAGSRLFKPGGHTHGSTHRELSSSLPALAFAD